MSEDEIAISVKGLSKRFYQQDGKEFWALKDVSFQVKKGEVFGVIGVNGSGKSTLLNILSQIVRPTEGVVELNGSCSSILDIGSGFHPDLSGRENVFFKGEMLGMSKKLIQAKFKDVVEFSELEPFIDEPIKTYSNGMFLRLAFSISIALAYEIILLDEVLAVGDVKFQNKCKARIKQEVQRGKTIVLVSHSLDEIRRLTDTCMLLDKGKVVSIDSQDSIIEQYRIINKNKSTGFEEPAKSDEVGIIDAKILNLNDKSEISEVYTDEPFEVVVRVSKTNNGQPLELMMTLINNVENLVLSDSKTFRESYSYPDLEDGVYEYRVKVPGDLLNIDTYRVACLCSSRLRRLIEPQIVGEIKVKPTAWEAKEDWSNQPASIRPKLDWTCAKID